LSSLKNHAGRDYPAANRSTKIPLPGLVNFRMDDKTFFTVMIESIDVQHSFIQVFWTWAKHPGAAIERVLMACARLGIRNAIAREADDLDFKSMPKKVIHDKTLNVFYADTRNYFPTEESFIAPFGIIKSFLDGGFDYELIREGFSLAKTEAGIYEIEAVVERDKLFNTFIELVKRLPSIKVFWIKLAADWEDKDLEEVWTNDDLNSVESITNFLSTHSKDTIANGHVALTVYSTIGETNLLIDTHKTIKILTKSATMHRKMAAALRRCGFEELTEFHSLEYGYYHWHCRPVRSKSRKRLVRELKSGGFKLWKSNVVKVDEDRLD
jgi:hypothetical protein